MSTVIGQVSIKVTPNLKGFAAKIRAEMAALRGETLDIDAVLNDEQLQAQIRAIAAQRHTVDFKGELDLDRDRAEEQLKTQDAVKIPGELEMSAAQMRAEAERKKPRDIRIPGTLDVDRNRLRRNIEALGEDMGRYMSAIQNRPGGVRGLTDMMLNNMGYSLDQQRMREFSQMWDNAHRDNARRDARDAAAQRARVRAIEAAGRADASRKAASNARRLTNMREAARKMQRIDTLAKSITRNSKAGERALSALGTTLHRGAGLRLTGLMVEDTWEPLANFDKHLPRLAVFTSAVTLATSSVTALLGNVLSLGRDVARIIPATLVLPGALMSAGVSIGALIMGLREFAERAPEATRIFSEIPERTANAFWAAGRQIPALMASLARDIRAGFEVVGEGAGSWLESVTSALRRVISAGDFAFMFGSVATAFRVMEGASTGIAVVLRELGLAGARWLPNMSSALRNATNNFASFLETARRTGDMDVWIRSAWQAMKDLGHATRGTYRVLDQLSAIAERSGGASLRGLGDYLNGVAEAMTRPHVAGAMERLFRSAHMSLTAFTDAVMPALGMLLESFSMVAETFGPNVTGAIGGLFGAFLEGTSAPAVMRSLDNFGIALRDISEIIQPVLKQSGEVAGILDTITAAVVPFGKMAAAAVGGLLIVIDDLGPALSVAVEAMGNAAANLMSAVFVPTMEWLAGKGDVIVRFADIVASAIDAVASLAGAFLELPGGVGLAVGAIATFAGTMALINTGARAVSGLVSFTRLVEGVNVAFLGADAAGLGFRGTMGKLLTPALRLGGRLLAIATAAGAIVGAAAAAAYGLDQWRQSMQNTIETGVELESQLRWIAASGDAASAWTGPDGKKIRGGGVSLTQGFVGALDDAENLVKAWRSRTDLIFADSEGKLFGMLSTGATTAVEHFRTLDAQLMGIAEDSLPTAQASFAAMRADLRDQNMTADELTEAYARYAETVREAVYDQHGVVLGNRELAEVMAGVSHEYNLTSLSADAAADSQFAQAEASYEAAQAARESEARIREQADAYAQMRDGIKNVAMSFGDVTAAVNAATSDSGFNMSKFREQLRQNAKDLEAWGENMVKLAGEIPPDMYMELMEMGPAGAQAVAEMGALGSEELAAVSDEWGAQGAGAAENATSSIMRAMAESYPLMFASLLEGGTQGAAGYVQGIEDGLASGLDLETAVESARQNLAQSQRWDGAGQASAERFKAGFSTAEPPSFDPVRTATADAARWEGAGQASAKRFKAGVEKAPVPSIDPERTAAADAGRWDGAGQAAARNFNTGFERVWSPNHDPERSASADAARWEGAGRAAAERRNAGIESVEVPTIDLSQWVTQSEGAAEGFRLLREHVSETQEQVRPGLPATGVSSITELGDTAEVTAGRFEGLGSGFALQAMLIGSSSMMALAGLVPLSIALAGVRDSSTAAAAATALMGAVVSTSAAATAAGLAQLSVVGQASMTMLSSSVLMGTLVSQASLVMLVGASRAAAGGFLVSTLAMSSAAAVASVRVSAAFQSMSAGARAGGASVRSTVSSTASTIRGAFSGVNLYSQGSRIMSSLNSGLRSRIGAVRATLQSVTRSIPLWKGPPKKDATLLTNAGKLIGQSLVDGLRVSFDGDLFPYLRDVTGEIAQLGAAPSSVLRGNAGRAGQPQGAESSQSGPTVQVNVNNPTPEKASDTQRKALAIATALL